MSIAGHIRDALGAQWDNGQNFIAEMAEDAAKKMESGELPMMDGPTALRWLAASTRALREVANE